MTDEPRQETPRQPYRHDGPLGGLLAHIPLQTRFAVTLGVVVGIIASVVAGGIDERAGQITLAIGVGAGLLVGIILAVRQQSTR